MPEVVDYLIIGAGPAGLQLGYFLQRAGRNYLILEAGDTAGYFYRKFPRHRQMISINKPHTGWDDPELNLRMDWNSLLSDDPELLFTRYSERYFPHADDYLRYLGDFAAGHRLNVRLRTRAVAVTRDETGFAVTDESGGVHRGRRLIVATGFGAPYLPPVPGIELAEPYTEVSVDPDDFTDQRVLIIGKGNSAFETADAITEKAAVIHLVGPSALKFAWRTHFIGHLRAVNNNFLDTYQLKTQNMVLDGQIQRIERQGEEFVMTLSYARRDKVVRLAYDRVIACTGFRLDGSIFTDECRPELTINDRFPALTSQWESVNVPDLFFAGTLTQVRDFKKYTSAFTHGFRYGIRAMWHMFDLRYEGVEWPYRGLAAKPDELADAVLARINRTSALWQQYSFLCDLVTVSPDGTARYYEEMPVDYVHDSDFGKADRCFTISLEYGRGHDSIDPFDVEAGRAWEADPSLDDRYLHPVVRYFRRGKQLAELKLPEDVCNDWSGEEEFRLPLRDFVAPKLVEA